MNVSLTPTLEKLVNKKVKTGLYSSASEVIREALRLLEEQDYRRQLDLKREIAIGLKDADQGNLIDGETVFKKLRNRHRQ